MARRITSSSDDNKHGKPTRSAVGRSVTGRSDVDRAVHHSPKPAAAAGKIAGVGKITGLGKNASAESAKKRLPRKISNGKVGKPRQTRAVSSRGAQSNAAAAASSAVSSSSAVSALASSQRSEAGKFVDARALQSEDLVAKTLHETSGMLGVATRPKIVDFSARLKERRRANMRVTILRALAATGIAIVLGFLVWVLFFSPALRLDVSKITVEGANEWVSEEQVLAIADEQAGRSLLLVSTRDVENKIKDIPGVTEASADKQFPQGMSVSVTAQKPSAMLKTSDDVLTAVDSQGRILNSVSDASVDGIPVIEVDDVQSAVQNRSIKTALKVVSNLPESLRTRINAVTAKTQDSVTTLLDDGNYTIIWGDSSDLELKKAVVDKILNDPNVIGDKHQIDVSAPLRPIIK